MQLIQQANAAGRHTPINDEAHIPGKEWGLKGNATQHHNSIDVDHLTQMVEAIDNPFNRLVRQFKALGLNLYALSGDVLLLSSPRLGLSRTLPGLHAAQAYLRQIGGAA